MTSLHFARILFIALDDPDERLAGLARDLKAAIEREDVAAADTGVRAVSARMRELRLLREAATVRRCSVCGAWMSLDGDNARGRHSEHNRQ